MAVADPILDQAIAEEPDERSHEYDVALSFAGDDRALVAEIADRLKAANVRIFYDEDQSAEMWGEDLAEYLDAVYRKRARFTVMFVSYHYVAKPWTTHERKSALSRAIFERGAYVLPVRLDDTELPGLRPTVAYLDSRQLGVDGIVHAIQRKLSLSTEIVEAPLQRVPRTPAEMQQMRDTQPAGWEYLLLVGALLHHRNALEEKYLDHQLEFAAPTTEFIDADAISGFIEQRLAEILMVTSSVEPLMGVKAQEWALGTPGQAGDPDRILHLASRWGSFYERSLDWSARVRGAVVADRYRSLLVALAQLADSPIESYRTFIDRAVADVDQLPAFLALSDAEQAAHPLRIVMDLTIDMPDDVLTAFRAERDRVVGL